LHREMEVPALYLLTPASAPVPITVRAWTKWSLLGAMPGKGEGWAEMQEASPKLVFMLDQVRPRKNAIISIEAGEAYRVDTSAVPDDITVIAQCLRLDDKNPAEKTILDNLPLPTDASAVVAQPTPMSVGVGVPPGGLKGDVLRKRSETDFDLMWVRGSFTFTQPTPSMNWSIPHNLGRIPVIAIVGNDGHEIEGEVIHSVPDYNTTQIVFTAPVSGAARLS